MVPIGASAITFILAEFRIQHGASINFDVWKTSVMILERHSAK